MPKTAILRLLLRSTSDQSLLRQLSRRLNQPGDGDLLLQLVSRLRPKLAGDEVERLPGFQWTFPRQAG